MPSGGRVAVLADRYRADVHQENGLGDGHCGFSVLLKRLDADGPVRIVCTSPLATLGTINVSYAPTTIHQPIVREQDGLIITIDQLSGQHITGWAASKVCPTSRRLLRLCSSGRQIIAQQRATLFREDAAAALPDGYHGFQFTVRGVAIKGLALEDVETGLIFAIRSSRCE